MKVFVVALLVVLAASALALTDEQKLFFQRNYQQCVQGTGVNEDLITKMRAGTFTEDAKLKTYIRCMFVKMGIMNEPGIVQLEVVKALIPASAKRAVAVAVAEQCAGTEGSDLDDKAFLVYKCFRNGAENPIPF